MNASDLQFMYCRISAKSLNVTDRRTKDGRSATIGVGAQSTLWGHDIFSRKMSMKNQQNARSLHNSCQKNWQNTRIVMVFFRKIVKIPELYMIFARKCPNFT